MALFVGTVSFAPLARYELTRRGMTELRAIFVEHPLGGVEPRDVLARADAVRASAAGLVAAAR